MSRWFCKGGVGLSEGRKLKYVINSKSCYGIFVGVGDLRYFKKVRIKVKILITILFKGVLC